MNVFEDLVIELKQENLLEMTVIDFERLEKAGASDPDALEAAEVPGNSFDLPLPEIEPEEPVGPPKADGEAEREAAADGVVDEGPEFAAADTPVFTEPVTDESYGDIAFETASSPVTDSISEGVEEPAGDQLSVSDIDTGEKGSDLGDSVKGFDATTAPVPGSAVPAAPERSPIPKKPKNGKEFYQKRAVGEVSNLQMVEHVLTGVEREYLKVVPNVFDDFNVKKSLHAFIHVTDSENSSAHQEAEFTLMNETEAWCSALANRDRGIPVSSLRQYCENSKPALSSQALLALARFYRNLPYSESVRSKFDFVITRLFSRAAEHEKRICLFTRPEALKHINTLYKDWSSISLYAAEDDDSKVLLTALSFDDLAKEAEAAASFDELIASDFFGRLRLFKESIAELFYAPIVTGVAIESNIRIGNTYVDLIARERQKMDAESIQSKYGDLYDDTVSDGAARTLDLVELLRTVPPLIEADDVYHEDVATDIERQKSPPASFVPVSDKSKNKSVSTYIANLRDHAFEVNKWFLAFAILLIAASVGVYVWANYVVREDVSTAVVQSINLDNSAIKEYVKTARVSGENFYALMEPVWDTLPKEKKQEILQKAYQLALEKGCVQVTVISKDGKMTGFASATRLEVVMP